MKLAIRIVVLALACRMISAAPGDSTNFTLTERLNRHWEHAFLSFPFEAPENACRAESVRLGGPSGPLPAQLYDIAYWPGTHYVRTAQIAFVVDMLEPLTQQVYRVDYAPHPPDNPPPEALMQITATTDYLEAASPCFAVRFSIGEHDYDPPLAPAMVPGPIVAMRNAAGDWFGGSRLYGNEPVSAFTAKIIESGPVFVRMRYEYRLADATLVTISMHFDASGGTIKAETETTNGHHPGDGWDIFFTPGTPPLALQYAQLGRDFRVLGGREVNGWLEKSIAEFGVGTLLHLAPWGSWWDETRHPAFYLPYLDTEEARARQPDGARDQSLQRIDARIRQGDGLIDDLDDILAMAATLEEESEERGPIRELMVRSRHPGEWVEPAATGSMEGWGRWERLMIPLVKGANGEVFTRINHVRGRRVWMFGEQRADRRPPPPGSTSTMPAEAVWPLDVVNRLVLDWPASAERHPRLFMDADSFGKAVADRPAAAASLLDATALRGGLGALGYFDTMRVTPSVIGRYDALVDAAATSDADRALYRAQMAYLAYRIASPANWSPERGYRSYNPNMTVAHVLNLGLAACALRDHPMAPEWIAYARHYFEDWLNRLDAAGYWPESAHYARYAAGNFMAFAIAMQRAGIHDYPSDPRVRRMGEWYEKTLTPPDGLIAPKRLSPPIGRGSHSSNWGLGGLLATATRDTAPDYSRRMQWSARQTDFGSVISSGMAGFGPLYIRRDLPFELPDWRSAWLPSLGPLLRSHLGTEHENYLIMATQPPSNPDGEIWPSEVGGILSWFADGIPLSRRFPSVPDMRADHGLLVNRVMLASNWRRGRTLPAGYNTRTTRRALTFLPSIDYLHATFDWQSAWTRIAAPPVGLPDYPAVPREGSPPTRWDRQLLWVRPSEPGAFQYLVLRDGVRGGQPTQWQFWTLSDRLEPRDPPPEPVVLGDDEKLELELDDLFDQLTAPGPRDDAGGTAGRLNALLDERPKPDMPPGIRPLHGDRFTAIGALGHDIDYFVASPTNTPRHTLRFAQSGHGYGVPPYTITQDLLHLQLHGDGDYCVVLHPRPADQESPRFVSLAGGKIVQVEGEHGIDTVFLAMEPAEIADGPVAFSGTAGFSRQTRDALLLTLGAPGMIRHGIYALRAPWPVSAHITSRQIIIHLPADHAGADPLELRVPGNWHAVDDPESGLKRADEWLMLTAPPGRDVITLLAAP